MMPEGSDQRLRTVTDMGTQPMLDGSERADIEVVGKRYERVSYLKDGRAVNNASRVSNSARVVFLGC